MDLRMLQGLRTARKIPFIVAAAVLLIVPAYVNDRMFWGGCLWGVVVMQLGTLILVLRQRTRATVGLEMIYGPGITRETQLAIEQALREDLSKAGVNLGVGRDAGPVNPPV